MRRTASLLALALMSALSTPALAATAMPFAGSDAAIRPQDDLFQAVNGGWLQSAVIPGDKKSYGTFMALREHADTDVRALLEAAAKHPSNDRTSQLIGDFYASLDDVSRLDHAGLRPLSRELGRIDGIHTLDDVARVIGELDDEGVAGPIAAYVNADEQNPNVYAVYWTQAGLGLPDRDYYLKPESASLREAYQAYLAELNRLAGVTHPDLAAREALALETELARLQWTRVERRDALKTYNPMPRDRWSSNLGAFPWTRFAEGAGMPASQGAVVEEPSYFKAFAATAAKTNLESWKAYLRTRLLDSFAPHLGQAYRDAQFHFKGEKLQGLKAMPPRWRTAVETTEEAVGEAIGARYVAKHFPPDAKARMEHLVQNLLTVYRSSLAQLSWMTPQTRAAALDKLTKLRVKIGYPDKWRGYAGLVVRRDDAVGNLLRANHFESARNMAEAGTPVDHTRWDMTPQTVNAYYNPVGNEIVFPAAILQKPFFDPKSDDAYNYGAIGAVIGHEISHGFDDQGRHYDSDGRLRDWWTASDAQAFETRAKRLSAQFDSYEPLPGLHVNGALTLGENIADLTGVSMAIKAYHLSLQGRMAPVQQGWTGDQRFFLGYARIWRSKSRPEWLKTRLLSDPHSPEQYRTNGVVTNVDAFYDAFGLKPDDRLYKAPEDRVRIW